MGVSVGGVQWGRLNRKSPQKKNQFVGNFDLNSITCNFRVLDFPRFLSIVGKRRIVSKAFGAFGVSVPFSDLAADIVGVGYETGPTTPSQIGGV